MLAQNTPNQLERYRNDPSAIMRDAGLTPDPWQSSLLASEADKTLVLCSRQAGKSSTVAMIVLRTALLRPATTCIVLAPIQPQANELLRKVSTAYYRIGRPVELLREGQTYIELVNRSRIIALPGKERSVHSYSTDLLVIDEAARVPDEVFHAASPQLSVSKGRMIALSTAFVKTGYFYREWSDGGPEYHRVSVTARDCPRHTAKFLEAERRAMGEWWFNAAYLNVFGDDVAAVFREEDIQAALDPTVRCLFDVPMDGGIVTGTLDPTIRRVFG